MIKNSSRIYSAPQAVEMALAEEQAFCKSSPTGGQIEEIEYEEWMI